MVCLAIRGFAEADRKAPLTQPGQSGARGVRLPAGKFDKLVERGASRGCDGIQHAAQLACRALLVSSGCGGSDRARARSVLGRLRFAMGRRDLAVLATPRLLWRVFEMWGFMAGLQVHHRDNRGACTT